MIIFFLNLKYQIQFRTEAIFSKPEHFDGDIAIHQI